MRRFGLSVSFIGIVALALGALLLPAGAGQGPPEDPVTTIIVRKVVSGPATAGSTVVFQCGEGEPATLTFDKTGAPDTTNVGSFTKVDGAWTLFTSLPEEPTSCTFTETVTGGAQSTAWTCAYESTEPDILKGTGLEQEPGCAAAAGSGTGPVTVVYGNFDTDVETQISTVTFTNTYVAPVAPPVDLQPNFTG